MNLKVAIGQLNPTVGNLGGNTAKIIEWIRKANHLKCHLLLFPELSITGYPIWDLANRKSFVDQNLEMLAQIKEETQGKTMTIVLGFIDEANAAKGRNYNSLAVIQNGKVIYKQAKTLLPTYDVFLEQVFFEPGTSQSVFEVRDMLMGGTICEDLWDDDYAAKPIALLARQGARVILNLSASPYSCRAVLRRRELVQRKAKEHSVWIIYANQVGGQDDLIFDGRSMVVSPAGEICYEAPAFKEELYVCDLGGEDVQTCVDLGKPISPKKEIQEIYDALVLGVADYIRKNGFQKVAIGLSGGIDSALVAAIARDALGSKSVIGVGMPGPYSSEASLRDAQDLAKRLKIEFRVKPISPSYDLFLQSNLAPSQKKSNRVTLPMENLQARLRGLTLMYLSNEEGALVLTTGNKSELAMGYCTLYGDMCGGLSVIGDVYKTQVYELAKYRNSISQVIPVSTIKKAPSAELRPNQKDQDSLPPYEILDAILFQYIEENQGADQIAEKLGGLNIARRVIDRVVSTVDHNEYKRRQLPPALRITDKAWFGRRMPITNCFDV